MRANELELLRASGVEPCLLMDNGGKTGRLPISEAALALRPGVNLLDNWYFVDPINQRGLTHYAGEGHIYNMYSVDRIQIYNGSSCDLVPGGLKFTYPGYSDAGNYIFGQPLDNISIIKGKQLTMSVLVTGFNGGGQGVNIFCNFYSDYQNGHVSQYCTGNGLYSTTFLIPDDADFISVGIMSILIPVTITVQAVKLELGEKQTLAHQDASGNWVLNDPPPNKALELAKCQRYQWVSSFPMAAIGLALDASTLRVPLSLPVSMRANPEANALNGSFSNFMINDIGRLANITCAFSGSLVELICTCEDASMAPGNVYRLIGYDSDVKLMLDANL